MPSTLLTYRIPCSRGGIVYSPNEGLVPPTALVDGTKNINLHRGGYEKRGGTAHVNGTAVSGTPEIMNLIDYTLVGSTQFIVLATNDGKIYKNYTTTIKTGLASDKKTSLEVFDNKLFIANGSDTPMYWDGAAGSTTTLTDIPSDWSGTDMPGQFVNHGRGNSQRLWALNVTGNLNSIYASANASGTDFSDANVIRLTIHTGEGDGIVGGVEFGDRLFCFAKRKTYIVDDADFDSSNWGYDTAPWSGGVAHWRLLVKTPNDLIAMMDNGEIYSVVAAQQYGDYRAASLTRPALIDKWIEDNIDLSKIDDFHAVYDPNIRAIKFFMVRSGQTTVDTALVYFVDRPPTEAWVVHDNTSNTSGYSASSATLVKVGAGDYQVYTGGYSGFVWNLEQSAKTDNTNAIDARFKTPKIDIDNPRGMKIFRKGFLILDPNEGENNVQVKWWVDGVAKTERTITVSGTTQVQYPFFTGAHGKKIQFEVYNSDASDNFFISDILLDYHPQETRGR